MKAVNQMETGSQKENEILKIEKIIEENGFKVVEKNVSKPWGAYFRLREEDVENFRKKYFPEIDSKLGTCEGCKMSPKFLLISPNVRLSWQYHERRSELWKIIYGPVGSILSHTDDQPDSTYHKPGDLVIVEKLQRHRIIGGENFGLVAEIWLHADPENPSEEEDNFRLEDDFGRKGTKDRGETIFYKK